jgi:hypothetical protein
MAQQQFDNQLSEAIAQGFLVLHRKNPALRRAFWMHCKETCLPFIQATVYRRRAYFLYDTDPTYGFTGDVRLTEEEMYRVLALLREALTQRGSAAGGTGHMGGGVFVPEKLLEVLPEIAGIAGDAAKRFRTETRPERIALAERNYAERNYA